MGFFSIFRKKNNSDDLELYFKDIPVLKEDVPSRELPVIDSPDLVSLVENNVIDTEDTLTIAKYIHNVELLRKKVLESKDIGDTAIIREDDFFPKDFIWRVNSPETEYESKNTIFSGMLREALAEERAGEKPAFLIPGDAYSKRREEELNKMPNDYMSLTLPVYFRTTKHFTVNTPLGFTGDYNAVKADRKYTIIDSSKGLLESGYGYSFAGRDAYLDVTHEGLPISSDAVILVTEKYFNEIKNNKELMALLNSRKLVVVKGSLDDAINMVLSEQGRLPFKPGCGILYDPNVADVVENNLKTICDSYNLEYEKSHGGLGGHFSNLIDDSVNYSENVYSEFLSFLEGKLGMQINPSVMRDYLQAKKFIDEIGASRLAGLVTEYNTFMEVKMNKSIDDYKKGRDSITKEESELFKMALGLIREHYKEYHYGDQELWQMVVRFFRSIDKDEQIQMAYSVIDRINSLKETR